MITFDVFWYVANVQRCDQEPTCGRSWESSQPYSFITFATQCPCMDLHTIPIRIILDTSSATSPSVFRERECSHLFLSHYIWESGSLKAQIWSLIGVEYERLPMLPYSTLTYPFDPTAAIRGGVLHLCSRVYRHGSAS